MAHANDSPPRANGFWKRCLTQTLGLCSQTEEAHFDPLRDPRFRVGAAPIVASEKPKRRARGMYVSVSASRVTIVQGKNTLTSFSIRGLELIAVFSVRRSIMVAATTGEKFVLFEYLINERDLKIFTLFFQVTHLVLDGDAIALFAIGANKKSLLFDHDTQSWKIKRVL